MQLVSLTLYSSTGQRKIIPFRLGALNVITGQSKTGKSVLVKLIDYCLGRATVPTSAGAVERALVWVGALWQFDDGGRAFVGRPIPNISQKENTRVMLILGDGDLAPPQFGELSENQNTRGMRLELGSRLGITESRVEPTGLREPFRTSLGHAALLCLQNQDEISSSTRIFHRSGERGIDDSLRDTIPYFLGAVPPDQALQKALLRQERRRLAEAERELRTAQEAAANLEADLVALLAEAVDVGLIGQASASGHSGRTEIIFALRRAVRDRDVAPALQDSPTDNQDAERRAQATMAEADIQLVRLMDQRSLLLDEAEGGNDYEDALVVQAGRLASLNLLSLDSEQTADDDAAAAAAMGVETSEVRNDATEVEDTATSENAGGAEGDDSVAAAQQCPVCGERTFDPTATEMRGSLERLGEQLSAVRNASPARSDALTRINTEIEQARARINAARSVLDAGLGADNAVGAEPLRRRDYTRGRIDAILARVPDTDEARIRELEQRVALRQSAFDAIAAQLSDDSERERLNSRLLGVGRTLTQYAQTLQLEHSDRQVRIDLAQLTVIADVDDQPVPLYRIGSAENWIGYHIASHLALHDTFIRYERPVPRILVVDQPSQGHYPSEVAKRTGRADTDADEIAVRGLYRLMADFTRAHDGHFQVIAVDHADIDAPWFQEAIVDNWRGAENKLIPITWLPEDRRADAEEPGQP